MRVKRNIRLFLISIACMASIVCFAQQRQTEIKPLQYRGIHWGMEDGLAWYSGNLMIKDAKGFMWFGTQWGGLCRFDGAVFEKMIFDKKNRNTINSEGIMAFVEDSLHNIWIGTKYELSRYDIMADTFTNFVTVIDSIHSKRTAVPFWSTRDQVYCLESDINIVSYNIHSFQRRTLLTITDSEYLRVGGVSLNYTILDSASNCLWMLESYDQR